MKSFMAGIDVGGTFTDGIAVDLRDGSVKLTKVATTPSNQADGVGAALKQLGVPVEDLEVLVHGTTVGTNAILERKGARAALITSQGFRDVLDLGRRERPQLYGMYGTNEPLIPRQLRVEVAERQGADGSSVVALDEDGLRSALKLLIDRGAESLVIGFLHSYKDPSNEERSREIASELWPNNYITISSAIVSEFREFERFGTAAVNAYLQPVIDRYLKKLTDWLAEHGYDGDLVVMQANGGMMTAKVACDKAANTVLSGPAAGVIAAKALGNASGIDNVISCDLGGTSFDVGLVVNGEPLVSNEKDLDYNVPLRIPTIDIHTIGAGGGSVAWVDEAGLLQVGPHSAGARPGPISYGRGGDEVTVTDANVLLGRLPNTGLMGVDEDVDLTHLNERLAETIGRPLGLTNVEAAAAILRVVNDKMAAAIRLMTVQRGFDPRAFTLMGFGGAGPLHAVELARELGIPEVLIPHSPGILCAIGCLTANVRHDFVQTMVSRLDQLPIDDVAEVLNRHRDSGSRMLLDEGVDESTIKISHVAEMQYEGQTHTVQVSVDPSHLAPLELENALADAYRERYGVELEGYTPRLVNLRTALEGERLGFDLKNTFEVDYLPAESVAKAQRGERAVHFDGSWHETPLYDRHALPRHSSLSGPAILEQDDSTIVLVPGSYGHVDDVGNLIVELKDEQ